MAGLERARTRKTEREREREREREKRQIDNLILCTCLVGTCDASIRADRVVCFILEMWFDGSLEVPPLRTIANVGIRMPCIPLSSLQRTPTFKEAGLSEDIIQYEETDRHDTTMKCVLSSAMDTCAELASRSGDSTTESRMRQLENRVGFLQSELEKAKSQLRTRHSQLNAMCSP